MDEIRDILGQFVEGKSSFIETQNRLEAFVQSETAAERERAEKAGSDC